MDLTISSYISAGHAVLGLELGSTRIKAVLIGPNYEPIAAGSHEWENRSVTREGVAEGAAFWSYELADAWEGLQSAYAKLAADVREKYGTEITRLAAIGVSGMMHGYLPFGAIDAEARQLADFRTWRNTITPRAAEELSARFNFNIPQRWSIAHLEQAFLNGEAHVPHVEALFTLASYVHWRLSGKRVVGINEASGMFPIDPLTLDYDAEMVRSYNGLCAERKIPWDIRNLLPRPLPAGAEAGFLTDDGARLLDPAGNLRGGALMCPPEGDVGTSLISTNCVRPGVANISAGTSIFLSLPLARPLAHKHPEIDIAAVPNGTQMAMAHCNNCCGDIDAWVRIFRAFASAAGAECSAEKAFEIFYASALEGAADCGGLTNFNFIASELFLHSPSARPLFVRNPEATFTLPNFARAQVFSIFASLMTRLATLIEKEGASFSSLVAQGGLFKSKGVAQRLLAAATRAPVTILSTAGEGGPWGAALLAAYALARKNGFEAPLEDFLADQPFAPGRCRATTVTPNAADIAGFEKYFENFTKLLPSTKSAAKA